MALAADVRAADRLCPVSTPARQPASAPGVVDLEPLFDDLGEPRPIPSLPEPAPMAVDTPSADPRAIAPRPLATATRTGPVLLYRSSEVALAVSTTREGRPVTAVRYRKATGVDAGAVGTERVRRGCAVLRFLSDGAYDLWLLDDPFQSREDAPPDRRILIQQRPVELDDRLVRASLEVTLARDEPKAVPGQPVAISAGQRENLDQAWDLLDRRALYSARQRFLESMKFADNPTSRLVEEVLSSVSKDTDETAAVRQILGVAGGHAELAESFYGLAKTHEAIADEVASWIREPIRVAIVCHRVAKTLDPNLVEAANDLGLLLVQAGRFEEAADCFRQACDSSGPDGAFALEHQRAYAVAAFNLGRCLEDMGRPAEACSAYRRARALDPTFAPARFELSRLRMADQSPALDTEELGELLSDLAAIVAEEGADGDCGRWAARALVALRDLPREYELNRSSFITRRLLPDESNYQTVVIEPTPSPSHPAHLADPDSKPEGQ